MKNLFVRQNNFKLTEEEPAGEIIELKIAAAMKIKWIYKRVYIIERKLKMIFTMVKEKDRQRLMRRFSAVNITIVNIDGWKISGKAAD